MNSNGADEKRPEASNFILHPDVRVFSFRILANSIRQIDDEEKEIIITTYHH